jgi:lipopolysaccharide/colanic/teichoic acid biosynthesis glycosyltransferase/O-antigen/teichoic acid export membrane protein
MTTAMMRPVIPPRDKPDQRDEPDQPTPPPRGSAQRAAVIAFLLVIVFQPILHPTGPGNSSPVDVLVVVAIATAAIWLAGTHRKLRAPYFVPVALFLVAGAASGLVSVLPTTALLTLLIETLLFAWCTTVVNVLSAPRLMRYALVAWSWSGIVWAAVFIAAWLGHITALEGLTPAEGNRLMFTFGDPNYASWYWDATIFVVYTSRTPAKRWMRFTGYGMLLWALILTESNGGTIALGLGISFLVAYRQYRRHGWAGALATGLAIGLAVGTFFTVLPLNQLRTLAANSNQPLLVNSIGRSAQSSSERGLLIHESIELFQTSSGLLGLGPASTKPILAAGLYPYANEAHDDFLAALSERGALGLLALILLGACVLVRAGPILRRPLSPPMAAAVPRPAGIVAALLAVGVNSFYEEILHFRTLWLLFGIAAVLGRDAWQTHQADRQRWFARLRPAAMSPVTTRPSRKAASNGRAPAGPERIPLAAYVPPVPVARSAARRPGSRLLSKQALTNLGAQGGALAAVSMASLLVARTGGPTVVGEYALIRVLPWLFGVVFSCGLPTASAFFLAGEHGKDRRVRPTLTLMALAGAAVGALAWLACVIPFHHVFFKQLPISLVFVMTALVVTQLWTVTAKGCCQGSGDIAGANIVIVAEELWFVPIYPVVLLTVGYKGATSVVIALIASGTLAMLTGLVRLWQRGYFTGWDRPSAALAKKIAGFGGRGQLGNMLWLMNLRFDFILLGALAGPAVLGIYAVASKFAELMRLVPTAINYVLYPRFARLKAAEATAEARRLLPQSTALTLVLTPFIAVATFIALPILYGKAFSAAVKPAEIIIIGLSVEGAAAVASAFLLGRGRPGLNSVGMGVGAAITVTLDVILIPRYGAIGGAVTSAITYLTTTLVLVLLARHQFRAVTRADGRPPAGLKNGADSRTRRAVDVLVAGIALAITGPVMVLLATAVRLTSRGPAFYRQVRMGSSGEQFTILKLRSMVSGADQAGPLVTSRADSRVTALGALLRATKLDELPQLINVLRGDMTLIGPRPEVPRFIPCYGDEELAILSVRPGLTGPGQIFYTQVQQAAVLDGVDPEEHYANCELHAKLAIDLDYLRRRSLRFDLLILVRTVLLLTKLGKPVPAPQPPQRVEDDEPTIVFAAWPAPPETVSASFDATIQFPRLAAEEPYFPSSARSSTRTKPHLYAEPARPAQAAVTDPGNQLTVAELDELRAIFEPDDELLDRPAATRPDNARRDFFFLELLAVILASAAFGSVLVLLLT